MRNLLFILSLYFLTGCYTHVAVKYPVKKPTYQVTHLLAVDSKGDTTQVNVNNFRPTFYNNPTYYSDWRFYWDNRWVTPYSYYRFYYRPYQPIYVYYPYPSWNTQSGNQRPQPKVDKPSQPRSTGTTRTQPKKSDDSKRRYRTENRNDN